MKKLFLTIVLLATVISANAATTSITMTANSWSNFPSVIANSPLKISSAIVTSAADQKASVGFYDTTGAFRVTNAAYTITSSYATNYISTYTNYYGVVTTLTNVALVDASTSVAENAHNLTPVFTAPAATNTTVTFSPLSISLLQGLYLTNASAGSTTITLTYTQ